MEFNASFNINSADITKKRLGINEGGRVQKYIDNECIKKMKPYTPFVGGDLEKSTSKTVIGSGLIKQGGSGAPYARYQYYGKLMLADNGSSWAKFGEKKNLTNKNLKYTKSGHPLAGRYWFDRMKKDKKDEILKEAQKLIEHN